MSKRSEWDFQGADTQYLTHNFHPFAAKFIPQIPSKLIRDYSQPGERVLDSFMGCGTTLVECKLLGREGVGVDINPLFVMITRAKITPLSEAKLEALKRWRTNLAREVQSIYGQTGLFSQRLESTVAHEPNWKNIDHWFSRNAKAELATIKDRINILNDEESRDFLLTCFSSIIVRASNQDSETRYARKDRQIRPLDTLNLFLRKLDSMLIRIRSFSKVCGKSKIELFVADARKLDFLENESFDLIVTSPPYMNAYDYHKYHRQRMHWLGIDPTPVRRVEIGGHDTYTRTNADPETYFKNMQVCFSEIFRLLKPQKHCFVVIGDSVVGGKNIRSQERFLELAKDIGFTNGSIIQRNVDESRKYFVCGARLGQEFIVCVKKP